MKKISVYFAALVFSGLLMPSLSSAARLKEIADMTGVRSNQLIGYGLVVGLDGTGDSSRQVPFAGESVSTLLSYLGTSIPPSRDWQLRNVATVMVTAELAAFAKPGQPIDVTVSSLGNARSLRGGTLLMTPLRAANGLVYAQAQGSVVVPGAAVGTASGSRTTVNQQVAGRIPSGAIVEQAAPELPAVGQIELNLRVADFAQVQLVAQRIDQFFGVAAAQPINARSIILAVPVEPAARAAVLAQLMELEVPQVAQAARVVMNPKTGSVVMNQSVRLLPVAVSHGNLTVRVEATNRVVQPTASSFESRPLVERNQAAAIDLGPVDNMKIVEGTASLDAVVRAINMLGATPQDLMAILQAMKAAGALNAEIESL
jgi:flagellar P-ring protein FlgI